MSRRLVSVVACALIDPDGRVLIAQRPADGFPHLFIETFAKAFEAKLRVLVPPPRGSFGANRKAADDADSQAAGDK